MKVVAGKVKSEKKSVRKTRNIQRNKTMILIYLTEGNILLFWCGGFSFGISFIKG